MNVMITRTTRSPGETDSLSQIGFQTGVDLFKTKQRSVDSSDGAARLGNKRLEPAIPDWCEPLLGWSARNGATPMARDRSAPGSVREPLVSDLVNAALTSVGYRLQNLRCSCNENTLVLSGFVTRYVDAQMAMEIVRRLASGRKIEFQIEILPVPDRNLTVV